MTAYTQIRTANRSRHSRLVNRGPSLIVAIALRHESARRGRVGRPADGVHFGPLLLPKITDAFRGQNRNYHLNNRHRLHIARTPSQTNTTMPKIIRKSGAPFTATLSY